MYQTLFEKKMSHRHYFFQKNAAPTFFRFSLAFSSWSAAGSTSHNGGAS
jgi:hypothetical protein